jgi:hypothetical protein
MPHFPYARERRRKKEGRSRSRLRKRERERERKKVPTAFTFNITIKNVTQELKMCPNHLVTSFDIFITFPIIRVKMGMRLFQKFKESPP